MELIFKLNPNTSQSNQEMLITIARMKYGVIDCRLVENVFSKEIHIEISKMSYQDVLDLGATLAENNFML